MTWSSQERRERQVEWTGTKRQIHFISTFLQLNVFSQCVKPEHRYSAAFAEISTLVLM